MTDEEVRAKALEIALAYYVYAARASVNGDENVRAPRTQVIETAVVFANYIANGE